MRPHGALIMGLVRLQEETWESLLLLSICNVRTQQEGSVQARKRDSPGPNMLTSWSWTFTLQNCEKINIICLSHPVYGILLQQPKLSHLVTQTTSTKLSSCMIGSKELQAFQLLRFYGASGLFYAYWRNLSLYLCTTEAYICFQKWRMCFGYGLSESN